MSRNTHDAALDHHGTAVAEQIASGTATAGYLPVSAGPGVPAAWASVPSGGGGGIVDLLTGDDSTFAASLGNWVNSGGTMTRSTSSSFLLPGRAATLKLVTTAQSQYAEVPVAGTFKAGQEYQALVMFMHESTDTPSGTSYQLDLGLIGTDAASMSETGAATGFTSTHLPYFAARVVRWVPTADRTGVTLRFTRSGTETGTIDWRLGQARVALVADGTPGLMVTPWTDLSDPTNYDTLVASGGPNGLRLMAGWNVTTQLNLAERGVGELRTRLAGYGAYDYTSPGTDSVANLWGEHAAGDLVQAGVEVSVGADFIGFFVGEKDATTIQFYADYGDYGFEFVDGATGRWRFRSHDNAYAAPSMGMLPQYAAAPGSPVEGQSYYDSVLHKSRTWDGSAWQNWW